jgi:hypothetical protein
VTPGGATSFPTILIHQKPSFDFNSLQLMWCRCERGMNEEEEDFSGIDFDVYFVDERCKEIERVLRENTGFVGYRVKRRRWARDWEFDPFLIQNENGDHLISLEPEIVDALNQSEFLSFVNVKMKRVDSSEDTFWLFIAIILLIPSAVFSPILAMILYSNPNILGLYVIALPLDFLILFLGIIYYRKRDRMISKRRQIDLTEAQEDPVFASALQKLASIPILEENREYKRRLKYIEDKLGRGSS